MHYCYLKKYKLKLAGIQFELINRPIHKDPTILWKEDNKK